MEKFQIEVCLENAVEAQEIIRDTCREVEATSTNTYIFFSEDEWEAACEYLKYNKIEFLTKSPYGVQWVR
jgi:hypothetical protein